MKDRRGDKTRSLARASLELSNLRCGTFGAMKSLGWSNTSRRLVGIRRNLKSLTELGRLKTLTSELNLDGLRSSTSLPRPKV